MSCRFAPNGKILILSALLLPVLLSLGNWQLRRAEEKRQLLAELESRSALPAAPVAQLLGNPDKRYRAVQVAGSFDNRHSFLLDNRVRRGRPGYEVITPLYSDSGHWLLVNRGWIEAPRYRHQLPQIPEIEGPVQLTGTIHTPLATTAAAYDPQPGWPKVIQALDFGSMGDSLGRPVAALTVRLRAAETASLQAGWPALNVQPEKHTAYAVQWFAMALALLALVVAASFTWRSPGYR